MDASAQAGGDSIKMKKVLGGYQFFQHHKFLKMGPLVKTLESNREAYKHIMSAQTANTLGSIIGGAGGFMVGWTLGTTIGGGEPT
jgi:hypothetical protein